MAIQDVFEPLLRLRDDVASQQGDPGVAPNVQPEAEQIVPPKAPGDPRLNQPAAPPAPQRGPLGRQYEQVAYDYGVPDPLTGIMVPTAQAQPGQRNPWIADRVQTIERAMDQMQLGVTQGKYAPEHAQIAMQRKQRELMSLDPQGIYRRGSAFNQMTNGEKWAAQNIFKDPKTGLVFFHNGRQWMVHEPKQDQNDYHQKLLDIREQHHKEALDHQDQRHKELMAHRDAQLEELKATHKMMMDQRQHEFDLRMQGKQSGAEAQAAKKAEHADFWKEYNKMVGDVTTRLTKKGTPASQGAPATPDELPEPATVAAHLDKYYPHMRKRRWEIEEEGKKLGAAEGGQAAPAHEPPANQLEASANKAFD